MAGNRCHRDIATHPPPALTHLSMPRSHLTFPSCRNGRRVSPGYSLGWAAPNPERRSGRRAQGRGGCEGRPDPARPLSSGPTAGQHRGSRARSRPVPEPPGPAARWYRSSGAHRPRAPQPARTGVPGPRSPPVTELPQPRSSPVPELSGPQTPGPTARP